MNFLLHFSDKTVNFKILHTNDVRFTNWFSLAKYYSITVYLSLIDVEKAVTAVNKLM